MLPYSPIHKVRNSPFFTVVCGDDNTVHSMHSMTMKEIIKRVWTIIALQPDPEKKKCMAKVFRDELYEGRGLCFTGRFTRVVNSLCGLVDGIRIEIAPMERLQGQLSALHRKLEQNMSKKDKDSDGSHDRDDLHDMWWLPELFGLLYEADMLKDFDTRAWPWIQPFVDSFVENEKYTRQEYIAQMAHTYFTEREEK